MIVSIDDALKILSVVCGTFNLGDERLSLGSFALNSTSNLVRRPFIDRMFYCTDAGDIYWQRDLILNFLLLRSFFSW